MKQVGDLKDRGTNKWQGMFLNEHREMLKERYEKYNQDKKPDPDNFDMQLIMEKIELALRHPNTAFIHMYRIRKLTRYYGVVLNINIATRILTYAGPFKD